MYVLQRILLLRGIAAGLTRSTYKRRSHGGSNAISDEGFAGWRILSQSLGRAFGDAYILPASRLSFATTAVAHNVLEEALQRSEPFQRFGTLWQNA
jgi:hypothetical protein